MMEMLKNGKVIYLRGMLLGSVLTYGALYVAGYAPLWFGPEKSWWSRAIEDDERIRVYLDNIPSGFIKFRPQPSTRNFVEQHNSDRGIRKIVFVNVLTTELRAMIKFGPMVEGPPRHVHGGASACVIDACLGILSHHTGVVPCLTANLNINYKKKIPLGSAVGIHCFLTKRDGRKLHIEFKVHKIDDEEFVYISGTSLFVKTLSSVAGLLK